MLHRSDPTYPQARLLLGEQALKENLQDRSQPQLNVLVDDVFRPVHERWRQCWEAEVKAEQWLNHARARRYSSLQQLGDALRRLDQVMRATVLQTGQTPTPFLVNGTLDLLYLPAEDLLMALAPSISLINVADEEIVPGWLRAALLDTYQDAAEAQRAVSSAQDLLELRRSERLTLDNAWYEAFNALHQGVEALALEHLSSPLREKARLGSLAAM